MTQSLSPQAQHANRLHLLAADAQRSIEMLEALLRQRGQGVCDGELHSAVMIASIIVYTRSFTKNKNTGGQADSSIKFSDLELARLPEFAELHGRLIEARNQAIAHSDWTIRQSNVVQRIETANSGTRGIIRARTLREGWEGISEQAFLNLLRAVWDESRQTTSRLDMESGAA